MQVKVKVQTFEATENENGTFTLADQNGNVSHVTAAQLAAQFEEVVQSAYLFNAAVDAEHIVKLTAQVEALEKRVNTLLHHAIDPSATTSYEVKTWIDTAV